MHNSRKTLRFAGAVAIAGAALVVAPLKNARAETHEWIGDQTGFIGLAPGWSFSEGGLWSGFEVPGTIYNPQNLDISDDDAIFGGQYDPPGVTPPYRLSTGGTIYFGDFDAAVTGPGQTHVFYAARDVVNRSLEVQSGDWTFDLGPGGYFPTVPITNSGSYEVFGNVSIGALVEHTSVQGNANLTIQHGQLMAGSLDVGLSAGGSGLLRITGSDASLNVGVGFDPVSGFYQGGIQVGTHGTGTFIAENGAHVVAARTSTGSSLAGYDVGSTGDIIARGAGTNLTTTGWILGYRGAGSLTVEAGALVTNAGDFTSVFLGIADSGSGVATVTGTGSAWTQISTLTIGGSYTDGKGQGTLNILDGGTVSATDVSLARSPMSSGVATIESLTTSPATWNIASSLNVGEKGTGNIAIDRGGVLHTGTTNIGYMAGGAGAVTIDNGGSWTDVNGVTLGANAGASGSLSVSHAVSSFSTSWLTVGNAGSGELSIKNGGTVSASNLFLGSMANGSGVLTISSSPDAISTLNVENTMRVGNQGGGSVSLEQGGVINASAAVVSIGSASAVATLEINASQMTGGELDIASNTNTSGAVHVTGGGSHLVIQGLDPGSNIFHGGINIGAYGQGQLIVENGAHVEGGRTALGPTTVGREAGSSGEFVARGDGTQVTTTGWSIGDSGVGAFTVEQGAVVKQTGDAVVLLGTFNTGNGTATVNGLGSTWTQISTMTIGGSFADVGGHGALDILDGGLVSASDVALGRSANGSGEVTISSSISSPSMWNISSELDVGYKGTGTVAIDHGGVLNTANSTIGTTTGGSGAVTIAHGGSWTNSGALNVGVQHGGAGQLSISDAASSVSTNQFYIGDAGVVTLDHGASMSAGAFFGSGNLTARGGATLHSAGLASINGAGTGHLVTITDPGSLWDLQDQIQVGYDSTSSPAGSQFQILNGAHVASKYAASTTASSGIVGLQSSSVGKVTVSGVGSQWTQDGAMVVGAHGEGHLTISDHGLITSADGYVGRFADSTGANLALLDGASSTWNVAHKMGVGSDGLVSTGHGELQLNSGATMTI
ncbi:MAG TPA: hypothetical protein VGJ26_02025, partial [Pirellulales bacterium]